MGWGGWSVVAAQSIRVIGYQLQLWYEIRDDTDTGLWLVNHRQYRPLIGWPVTRGSDKRSDAEINQHQKSSSPRHGAHSKDQISWYLRFSKIDTDPDQSFPAYSQHSPELSFSLFTGLEPSSILLSEFSRQIVMLHRSDSQCSARVPEWHLSL